MTDLATWQRRDARRRAQWREWHRRQRAAAKPYGWLHALSCTESRGNHRARKRCQPIPIYDPRLVADERDAA